MKKNIALILCIILSLSLLASCGEYKEPPAIGFLTAGQFTGYKLGTVADIVPVKVITESIDSPEVVKFSSVEDGLEALRNKKIHGFVLPAVYTINETEKSDDFTPTKIPFIDKQLRAISLNGFEYSVPVDAALTTLQNNGTARKIAEAYSPYADEASPYTRPAEYDKLPGRTITVGICSDDAFPYNYHDADGKLVGINVDVAYEIAKGIHAELVIKEYPEDKLMGALDSGEADIILSQFYESEQAPLDTDYLYSHPYCDASTHILIRSLFADLSDKQAAKAE
ncbi:MAG: transporter substrate-binding domain-containing protein [Oscillospiraceae bacterium]|nr:transporter substrate-binding domain-containing protein [Oscillospiraceae bacterium]